MSDSGPRRSGPGPRPDGPRLDRGARDRLRGVLLAAYPWLGEPDRGPRAVTAGPCDRCGQLPRLLPTCGPVAWAALCRPCAGEVGADGWCHGHAAHGRGLRTWAGGLGEEWPHVVRLWWVATGELRLGTVVVPPDAAARIRAALPGGSAGVLPPGAVGGGDV